MSAEVKSGIAFGVIMVVIGLAAIWIVRWQTYVLLRNEGMPSLPLFSVDYDWWSWSLMNT
jgi:hypothetical protein